MPGLGDNGHRMLSSSFAELVDLNNMWKQHLYYLNKSSSFAELVDLNNDFIQAIHRIYRQALSRSLWI